METQGNRGKDARFILAFVGLAVAQFVVAIDLTGLAVALPVSYHFYLYYGPQNVVTDDFEQVIASNFQASSTQTFWCGIAFLLVAVVTQPLVTSLSDVFGRRIVLLVCAITVVIGSIIMGCASTMNMVIAGRVVQGLGGGGLDVLPEVILTDITSLKERSLWIGLQNLSVAIGTVLGPIIGAVLSEKVSWRWLAWITLPLLTLVVVMLLFFLTLQPVEGTMGQKLKQIDWVGIPLFMVGLSAFVLPLTWSGVIYPWSSWQSLTPLLVGVLLMALFAVYETKTSTPMLPPHLFFTRNGALPLLCTFVHGLAIYAILFYLPIYFEAAHRYTPLQTAVATMPLSFTVVPFGVIAAMTIQVTQRYRIVIWGGWVCAIVGTGLMSLLTRETSVTTRSGFQALAGLGYGALFPALILPMQAGFPGDDAGIAMGTFVWFRLVGSVVGLAVGSAVFSNTFNSAISSLGSLPPVATPFASSNSAIGFIPSLRGLDISPKLRDAISETFAVSTGWIWITLAVIGCLGFVSSLFLRELDLDQAGTGRQRFQPGISPSMELN